MVKYLQHLLSDIELSKEQAPPRSCLPDFNDDEDGESFDATKLVKLDDLLGIPAQSFPPDKLLSDEQVQQLLEAIHSLWKSWQLWFDLPNKLMERQQYNALLHAMQHEQVAWHFNLGGEVKICRFEEGTYCPFGQKGGYCYCKEIDEAANHDIALWEEHVRSQGLDPYRELTQEEEQAFEEEMRVRNLRKRFGDNWDKHDRYEPYLEFETEYEDNWDEEAEEAGSFDDWMEGFIWEDEQSQATSDDFDANSQKDYGADKPKGGFGDENEFDLPFF